MSSPFASVTLAAATLCLSCTRTPSPLVPNFVGTLGTPGHGVLSAGAELPIAGPGFRWLKASGHHYGLPRFVNAIARAAEEVDRQRPGGAPLMIGDLSRRFGGRIAGHRTHRSGRDADLLFYVITPAGESTQNPGFFKFGPDGLAAISSDRGAPKYVRLDVPREWLLIKTLLTTPDANVQWMFVSAPVEALLTEYARARGEENELVWHAETVMLQPGDSLPHDDHLHLRTACTPDEAVLGCDGGGPYWPWLPPLPTTVPPESDDSLALALLSPIESQVAPSVDPTPFVTLPPADEGARGLAPPRGGETRQPPGEPSGVR